jgi:hypothetical protein
VETTQRPSGTTTHRYGIAKLDRAASPSLLNNKVAIANLRCISTGADNDHLVNYRTKKTLGCTERHV